MNFVNELLLVGFIPLAVAAAAAYIVRRLRMPPPVSWAAGVALGYVAGHIALASWSGFARATRSLLAPSEASHWLPHAVLLAAGVTMLATYAPRRWRQGALGLAAMLVIGVPVRLLAGSVAQKWSPLEKLSYLALLAASLALVWLLLAVTRGENLSRLRQVLLIVTAVAVAIATTLSGSFALGRLSGVFAAALTGTSIASPRGLSGAAGVVAVALNSLILLGVFYAKLQPMSAALLLTSTVAAAGRLPEVVSTLPVSQQVFVRTALCLTPLSAALAISWA